MDAKSLELLRKILRNKGYSMTLPRKIACELLWNREPQSLSDLTVQSKRDMDRASLYRTVALYEKLGIVHRIYIGWKYKIELSDILTHHHHHISCLNCGAVVAITEENKIESLINEMSAKHGFRAQSHQLEIRGLCAECANKKTTSLA